GGWPAATASASARAAFLRRGVRRPARAALGMRRLCQVRRAGARHQRWRSATNRISFAAMPRLAALFAIVSVAASGCATSSNTVQAAKEARYNVSFNTVWQVVQEEVHRRYTAIHREDAVAGVIETDYRAVETGNPDVSQAMPTGYSNIGTNSLSRPIPNSAR